MRGVRGALQSAVTRMLYSLVAVPGLPLLRRCSDIATGHRWHPNLVFVLPLATS